MRCKGTRRRNNVCSKPALYPENQAPIWITRRKALRVGEPQKVDGGVLFLREPKDGESGTFK